MKQYTLITRIPKSRTKSAFVDDSHTPYGDDIPKSPFEELLEYKPETNNIDNQLHIAILDENELADLHVTRSSIKHTMTQMDDEEDQE